MREAAERAEQAAAARRRRLTRLGALFAIAAIAVVAVVVLSGGGSTTPTTNAAKGATEGRSMLDGIPQQGTTLGRPDAPVVLTEFADLQCPYCKDFALQVLPTLIERYVRPGKLRIDFRFLRFIGPDSDRGARAALAAAEQDRMWEFVDLWYRNQGAEASGYADDDFISGVATGAGLSASTVMEAIATSAGEDVITAGEQLAQQKGIDSTPSFVVGPKPGEGRVLNVTQLSADAFAKALEPALTPSSG